MIVLLIISSVVSGCGRKGALKPPADARPVPQELSQEDESNPSNQPAAAEPVISE